MCWLRIVQWRRGGRGRGGRRGSSWGWGLRCWCLGRCGATASRLGSVVVDTVIGQRTGQIKAPDSGRDRGVEGQLSSSDGGGGPGWDGQRRWRGELAAETRRFVIHVVHASVILIGGKKQLQRPKKEHKY